MSFNGSGTYVPPAGIPVASGTVIQSSVFNGVMTDLGLTFGNTLPRDGQAPMLAALKLVDGTAAAPALTFNSDANTGLFRPGIGALALSVTGNEQLRIVDGAVLVGQTASTGERFQVTGNTKLDGDLVVTGTVTFVGSTSPDYAASKSYVDALIAPTVVVVSGVSQAAVAGSHYVLTNTGGVTTLTLPASPNVGDTIYVTNATTRTDALIERNGHLLYGLAEDFTFDKLDATVCLRFIGAAYGWRQA